MLKEQLTVVLRENAVLKRAVAIQHERQKEFYERSQEVQSLKQLVVQYQEQLRTLEVATTILSPFASFFLFLPNIHTDEESTGVKNAADKQLCADDASEAGSAEQLHPRALQS